MNEEQDHQLPFWISADTVLTEGRLPASGQISVTIRFDEQVPGSWKAALNFLDNLKKAAFKRDMWETVGYDLTVSKLLIEHPKYRKDFQDFAWVFMMSEATGDRLSSEIHAKEFFARYPILHCLYGCLPLPLSRIEVSHELYLCTTCLRVTPRSGGPAELVHCCEHPKLLPFYSISIGPVLGSAVTHRLIAQYKELIKRVVDNEVSTLRTLERLGQTPLWRLAPGERSGSREDRERRRRDLEKIAERYTLYTKEYRRWQKNQGYRSQVITRLRDMGLGPAASSDRAAYDLLDDDLEQYVKENGGKRIKVESLLRSYKVRKK